MSDPNPPTRVVKRDGSVVDFDADRISRALFAASERTGRPDAFLARELADGVVHFLTQESDAATISTQQIAEVVVKVVRELGQPALAAAFEEHAHQRERRSVDANAVSQPASTRPSLAQSLADCARRFTLQTVYTRDLAAAQEAGLLTLTGLQTPDKLAGGVLGPPVSLTGNLVVALEQMRGFVGRLAALDGLEHLAATTGQTTRELAEAVAVGLRLTGLHGVVNLNIATPPPWAGPLAEGPLFAARPLDASRVQRLADELRTELLHLAEPRVRIDWHLNEATFGDLPRLQRVAADALEGANIGFVFDRPRRPAALAEGLDRKHPATLLMVGLHLPALVHQRGMLADVERFHQSLGSLVRLALSAAVQKRRFLRDQDRGRPVGPALTSSFLLDRARFVVAPVGLDAVVQLYTDWGLCNGGESLELGRRIMQRLRDVLRQDGRSAQLDACLDGPWTFGLEEAPAERNAVAGLTPWNPSASARSQLRAGGVLHGLAEHGTLALLTPRNEPVGPEQLVEHLERAWRRTDVVRLRVVRVAP